MKCCLHLVRVLQTEAVGSHILDITQLYASIVLAHTGCIYYKFTRHEEETHAIRRYICCILPVTIVVSCMKATWYGSTF